MDDIVPGLLEKIQKDFFEAAENNPELKRLLLLLTNGKANFIDAHEFAVSLGRLISDALQQNISSAVLPEGKMYYNIAERILNDILGTNHRMVSSYAMRVQDALNKEAGIGLKSIQAPINQARIDSLINRIAYENTFDDVSWILGEPVVNFSKNVVDKHIQVNADFHYNAGLKPKIIRSTDGNCCAWCSKIAGVYAYPNVNKDVFRRHDRCNCTVDYHPGDGKKQNVWSKKWDNSYKSSIIDTKRLDNIILPKSVSAKARDIYVKIPYPVRGTETVKKGSTITNVNVIAGKDVRRQIDDIRRLVEQYKTKNEKLWQKVTGIATLESGRVAELHWYQHPSVGKVEFKVKRWIK
nr:MAG TPA: hypothetical protein [Caudoviricetes sp.]